ncbi:MAG: diheme cytochrome c [Thermodesulfobacteriota bacterium]|nr:diheme cytochrome c [Thermodesulfobacteriota bacterium]
MANLFKNNAILVGCLLLLLVPVSVVLADDDHEQSEGSSFGPIINDTVKKKCGACHFAYQPGLLPAASWEKIVAGLPVHFGEEIVLDQGSKAIILEYLCENAADHSPAGRSKEIMKSLDGQTPLRITETPYFFEKHYGLPSSVFNLPSIGARSNCIACHSTAEQGSYDDSVKIPR